MENRMLDSLSNVDLSGIGGYIRYDNSGEASAAILTALAVFFIAGALVWFLMKMVSAIVPKSLSYRKDLANLYVAAKIKQIAKKEGIDLNLELLEFRKALKQEKLKMEDLDTAIEEELKEEISEDFKKKTEKSSK